MNVFRYNPARKGVVAVSFILVVAGIVSIAFLGDPFESMEQPSWLIYLVIGIAYVLAEHFVFYVEREHDIITFSVAEVPTALALTFLSPVIAVPLRIVTSVAVMGWSIGWSKKVAPSKLVFNALLFGVDSIMAYAIVRSLFDVNTNDRNGEYLLAVAAALAISQTFSLLMVSAVIAWFEPGFVVRVVGDVRRGMLHVPVVAVTAAMALAPSLVDGRLALIGMLPVVAVWVLVREHGRLAQYFRDLNDTNASGGLITRARTATEVCQLAVDQVSRLFRADNVTLVTFGRGGGITGTYTVGGALPDIPTDAADPQWSEVFALDKTAVVGYEGAPSAVALGGRGRYLATPVRSEEGLIGLLVIGGRGGPMAVFDQAEMNRVDILVGHLATTLERVYLHTSMEHAAMHDLLTGLPNRLSFERAVDGLTGEPGGDDAVMMLDLDRFKEVNDTLGHHVGDRVLVEFARRLRQTIGLNDVLARFGGDEFAILARRSDPSDLGRVADDIVTESFRPLQLDDLDVVVTATIGVFLIEGSLSSSEILRRADVAVTTAKRAKVRIEWYRPEIDRRTPDRLSMVADLRHGLNISAVEVHFQPKVDLSNGVVIGAEALARWERPGHGSISALDLVRIAEESGLIKQVTDYVLVESIKSVRRWLDRGFQLAVAVNLSTHDLLDEQMPLRIARLLEIYDVPSSWLTLEITESALLSDTPRTMATIRRLSEMGVQLSLDDFGTGYSSLGYLRRLPVNELKVDRTFVSGVLLDDQDEVIVRSTIELGHNLGLTVVAEGIENRPVYDRLRKLGCDFGQGYGISRALPLDRLFIWLESTEYMVMTTRDA